MSKPTRLVLHYARGYIVPLTVTILSMVLLIGAQLIIPWIIKTLIAAVTQNPVQASTLPLITRLTILAFAVYLLRAGLQFLRSYMAHVAGWGVVADLRKHVYTHLQRLTLRFYEDKQTGQMMSRVVNDTDMFEGLIAHAIPDVLVNVLTFVGISAMLFSMNWRLTLISMAPIPLVILSLRIYARYVRPAFRNRQKMLGELNAILNDNISGIREIKAFTRGKPNPSALAKASTATASPSFPPCA
jgi:ATP-binding cassette subfamily B protein/subfamily B ATP-binding cassette protein MsbA